MEKRWSHQRVPPGYLYPRVVSCLTDCLLGKEFCRLTDCNASFSFFFFSLPPLPVQQPQDSISHIYAVTAVQQEVILGQ